MHQLTANTYWLTDAIGAHCYWLDAGERVAIIDPGMSSGLNRVARELRKAGRSPYEVTDILLTHADVDHAQAAAEWQRRTGARCWLGAADAAVLTGAAQPGTPFRRLTVRFGRPELPRNLHLLDGDAELWPGLSAIHTPGHTPGHFSFLAGRTLFGGDTALATTSGLAPMPSLLMTDDDQGLVDLARLGRLDTDWLCFGHSDPVRR
ncbi:MAG TPA: MBL fold metallo-hydrolase [Propionicimonas sp.]|nr:MBL fold metallo-hydrolase [Propionicimonas sp.]HRA06568.1 MBL fold metallo-hydrolase [Propionicimonas sp.]